MYHYLLKGKARVALFFLLSCASCVAGALFALVMSALVDCVGKTGKELLLTFLGSVVYVIIYIVLGIFYRFIRAAFLADARYRLKNDIFTGIMNRSIADFDTVNSAEYINEMSNNLSMFEAVYFENIITAFEVVVSFLAAAAVCLAVQPLMLVLMIALAFVTMAVTKFTTSPLEKSSQKFAERFGEYTAELSDDFGAFRLAHSFGILGHILNKHNQKNREAEDAKKENTNCQTVCGYVGSFVGLLSTVFVMALAAYFSQKGMFSAGMIIAFGQLIGQIVSPITMVPAVIANFRAAKPLQERFQNLIEQKGEKGTETITNLNDAVEFENVSFGYQKEKEVIHQLSVRLEAKKHYAIVGSSGSGKSTFLSLLLGYYQSYSGNIRFDSTELRNLRRDTLGELIGVVSQDTFLFNDSIRNNITLYQDNYTEEQVNDAIRQAGLSELVSSLPEGISTVIDENGKNFSGGEKQRFSLARVLLRNKKVLLFDEFTASMDEPTAKEIEGRLLARDDSMIVTVTHRLNPEMLRRYDNILVLSQGEIVETGSYDKLMETNGYLKNMV